MKQLAVLLLPPGWDAGPSQGYPPQYVAGTHLYTWVKKDNVEQCFLFKETAMKRPTKPRTADLAIFLPYDRISDALTTTPPRLHNTTTNLG